MAQRYIDPSDPSLGTYDDENQRNGNSGDPARTPVPGTGGYSNLLSQQGQSPVLVNTSQPGQDNASPWATAPQDGDWGAWFLRNIQSEPPNSGSLERLIPLLKSHGIEVMKNASGIYGKIKLPNGQVKDVGRAFSSGDPSQMAWQWLDAGDNGGEGDWFDQNIELTPEPYETLARPSYLQGEYIPPEWNEEFKAPSAGDLYADPGYQGRLDASRKGFERSAAAKGSILSGGSQVALGRQQQDLASQEYGQLFGRAYDTYQQRYGQFKDRLASDFGARGLNESAYQNDESNNSNRYDKRYRTWRSAVDDQFRLGELGFNATTAGA